MALTEIKTSGIADDAVTTDKLANAINTARDANTAKASITINNNADNRVITGSGTANTLEGEANLTFDGQTLKVDNTSANPQFHLTSAANGLCELKFGDANDTTRGNIIYRNGTAGDALCFNGYNNTERMRIASDGSLLLNTTAVTNTNDQLTVKRPASDFTEMSLSLDATTATGSSANALIFTKSKGSYWNGYAFQSSHGYIGALLGKRDSSGTTDQEIRLEIGGDSPNQNEEKTWTFENAGNLSIDDGNLKLASGHGIDFSATAHATNMSSELLDDYEEGTYTPEVILGGGQSGVTQPSTRNGSYTRIGDRVYFNIHITGTLSYTGSIYHGIHISLPYNTNSYSYAALSVWFYAGVENEHEVIARTENNDNKLVIQYPGDSIAYRHSDGDWNMMISGHYEGT